MAGLGDGFGKESGQASRSHGFHHGDCYFQWLLIRFSPSSVAPCRCQEVQPAIFRLPLLVLTIAGCSGTAPPNQLQTEFILGWKPWKSELEGK